MITPATIGLIGAGVGSLFGIGQMMKANRLEKNLTMPTYQVNQNLANNYAIANNMANVGLPAQQYNNILNQNNQNLASILASASRSGRTLGVGSLLRQANQATQNLNIADAQARNQNQRLAMQQGQVLAQEERNAWNWNFRDPYLRTAQRIASLRGAGTQNLFGGIGLAGQIGMASLGGKNSGLNN